jgi:predicted metalloprotease with PDZ domain
VIVGLAGVLFFAGLPAAALLSAATTAPKATGRLSSPAEAKVATGPLTVAVDATEAPRRVFHVRETIPVAPGALTLAYPKWIPGEHAPTGPIVDVVGMRLSAGGRALAWKRDPVEMSLVHVEMPADAGGVLAAEIEFVTGTEGIFTAGGGATANLAVVSWNQMLLYPAGPKSDDINVRAELKLPAGWFYGTALEAESGPPVGGPAPGGPAPPPAAEDAPPATIRFRPVSLTTLVDSPVLAGAHLRTLALSPPDDPRPAYLHMGADSEAAVAAKPEVLDAFRRLVAEAQALFGARHYNQYHFLLTLSDHTAHFGLEHHQSSDNRTPERFLVDDSQHLLHADLLAHEMTHSWNGKYRRPVGLATPDFRQPMDGTLLWVYEGLTNYLGFVLAARSGLYAPEETRDHLAGIAATLDNRPGRAWRPLEDTATAVQTLYGGADAWENLRRGVDYYDEGTLIWLEADTLIRQKTGGRKSLDDFCRLFLGGVDGPPALKTYTAEDVYATLNQVAAHDWKEFFSERVEQVRPRAPLGGIEAAGWRLAYGDVKGPRVKAKEEVDDVTDARFSLGFDVSKSAGLIDVIAGTPAARAGLAPGMKIVAVDGRRFSRNVLEDALRLGKGGPDPIEILAENAEFFRSYKVAWNGGLRFPKLERDPAKADLLADIVRARSTAAPAPAPSR